MADATFFAPDISGGITTATQYTGVACARVLQAVIILLTATRLGAWPLLPS